jgi:hypothetical protein
MDTFDEQIQAHRTHFLVRAAVRAAIIESRNTVQKAEEVQPAGGRIIKAVMSDGVEAVDECT